MMTAAEATRSGIRGTFHELKTDFWAVHIQAPAGLAEMMQMAARSIMLVKK